MSYVNLFTPTTRAICVNSLKVVYYLLIQFVFPRILRVQQLEEWLEITEK
jgi:hypothetical protein